jgi:hypothetical protein
MSEIVSILVYIFLLYISFKFLLFLFKFNLDPKPLILAEPQDIKDLTKQENINYKNDIKLLELKDILKKRLTSKKCK